MDLDKLNMTKLTWQFNFRQTIFATAPQNITCYKSGLKWPKNNHLASFIKLSLKPWSTLYLYREQRWNKFAILRFFLPESSSSTILRWFLRSTWSPPWRWLVRGTPVRPNVCEQFSGVDSGPANRKRLCKMKREREKEMFILDVLFENKNIFINFFR